MKLLTKAEQKSLMELLSFTDRYDISIQFWVDQTAVYIHKGDVDLKDYGGDFDFAINASIEYLKRINNLKTA